MYAVMVLTSLLSRSTCVLDIEELFDFLLKQISLNGCHVCEAPYQMSLKEVNCLEVTGSILLHRIFCQQPCHADQQVYWSLLSRFPTHWKHF